MPNIKSAIKRVKVAERNRQKNRTWRTAVRTVTTDLTKAAQSGKGSDPQKAINRAYKIIDMAVAKGILHKNAAARRKSRMAKRSNVVAAPKTQAKKKK